MKKVVSSSALLVSALIVGFLMFGGHSPAKSPEATPSPVLAASAKNKVSVKFGESTYEAAWYQVDNTDNLSLGINLEDQKSASQIFSDEHCRALINGGFYTPNHEALGLIVRNSVEYSPELKSSLTNGFFSVNQLGTARITPARPRDELVLALQSGPLLLSNASYQGLNIQNDKPARRSVVATTGENKAIFLIIYDPDSSFLGPMLADLPQVLAEFENSSGISLADALNLDGGSASAFYTDEVALSELSPIGSYFCAK